VLIGKCFGEASLLFVVIAVIVFRIKGKIVMCVTAMLYCGAQYADTYEQYLQVILV